ncbi:unnamed protein product [Paramecium sonneborni]|uniref:MORN repeat protein n=1 Tax=Paramecium sonneborni TaxID=65129 RepID=A0A8S1RJ12_9CILI|nr:unnamed protein product [Paramecium sonneborni]
MDGYGIMSWLDGNKYEGEYQNDQKHGFKTFQCGVGGKYYELWLNEKQDEEGQQTTITGQQRKEILEEGNRAKWL